MAGHRINTLRVNIGPSSIQTHSHTIPTKIVDKTLCNCEIFTTDPVKDLGAQSPRSLHDKQSIDGQSQQYNAKAGEGGHKFHRER